MPRAFLFAFSLIVISLSLILPGCGRSEKPDENSNVDQTPQESSKTPTRKSDSEQLATPTSPATTPSVGASSTVPTEPKPSTQTAVASPTPTQPLLSTRTIIATPTPTPPPSNIVVSEFRCVYSPGNWEGSVTVTNNEKITVDKYLEIQLIDREGKPLLQNSIVEYLLLPAGGSKTHEWVQTGPGMEFAQNPASCLISLYESLQYSVNKKLYNQWEVLVTSK